MNSEQERSARPPSTKTILKKPPAPLKNTTKAPAIAGHCARLSEISAGINFLHIRRAKRVPKHPTSAGKAEVTNNSRPKNIATQFLSKGCCDCFFRVPGLLFLLGNKRKRRKRLQKE